MRFRMHASFLIAVLAALPVPLLAGEIMVDGNAAFHEGNDGAGSGLDADLLDGLDSSDLAPAAHTHPGSPYAAVAVVAKAGGDYTDPATAMSDLASWCGTPTETTPCLLEIAPGIYDLVGSFDMVPFVDVEGSGSFVTRLRGMPASGGVVNGSDDAEMRHLTIEHLGGTAEVAGFRTVDTSPRLTHARIVVAANGGPSVSTYGILVGGNGSPVFRHVDIEVEDGRGIQSGGSGGRPLFRDVSIVGNGVSAGGVVISDGRPDFRNLDVQMGGSGTFNVGVRCSSSDAPTIVGGRLVATGGTHSFGVLNVGCSPLLENLEILAAGGTDINVGIYNSNASGATIQGVRARAQNGSLAAGIFFSGGATGATVRVHSSVIESSFATANAGIRAECSGGTVEVHSSQVTSEVPVSEANTCSVSVGGSFLSGPSATVGTVTCAGVYDENFVFSADTCP